MSDFVERGREMDRPARILLVDDERVYRESMNVWLTMQGYDVVVAMDGSEALQKLSDGKFDLVFTDFVMPGLDGLALLKAIRAEDSLIPVLMVTGFDDRLASIANMANSVTSVASKSVDLAILHDHIKRLVRK